jgi:hypothetical protein
MSFKEVLKKQNEAACQALLPIILATWEAEIRRVTVLGQLSQIVCETPRSPKEPEENVLEVWLRWLSTCFLKFN